MKKFDIFISYRRAGGFEVADSVYQRLVAKHYSAFLDMEQLNAGTFNTKLLDVIDGCKDFILILPPHALDRCSDEEDWVRREVEHAIKGGKNIIPIMLRGFEWPAKESLPESLRELPNYNGITAADHNVYVENIERLKHNFLTSRPIPWWKRYGRYLFVLLFLLMAALATGVVMHCINDKDKTEQQGVPAEYEAVCKAYVTNLMTEYVKMDSNLAAIGNFNGLWKEFLRDCETGKYDRDGLIADFESLVEMCRKDLKPTGAIDLNEADMLVLRNHHPHYEDIVAMQPLIDMSYSEANRYLDQLIQYSHQEYPVQFERTAELDYEFMKSMLKMDYVSALGICADMPKSVESIVRSMMTALSNPVDIVIGQKYEDYEALVLIYVNECEEIMRQMAYVPAVMEDTIGVAEVISNQLDEAYASLDEWVAKVRESAVVEIDSTDDISSAWTKIAEYANATNKMDECAELVSAKLHEYCNVMDEARMEHDIVPDEVFNLEDFKANYIMPAYGKLYELLAQYKELNPNNDKYIADYVASAEMYYTGISLGYASAETGLLVFATGGDEEHPVIKVGDIIIEVDGKPIATYEDYDAARGARDKAQPAKVMRIGEDKSMGVVEVMMPVNSTIELGFLPLYM